jgi:Fic family protein
VNILSFAANIDIFAAIKAVNMAYIYTSKDWPNMYWRTEELAALLAKVRNQQGWLLGRMAGLGFALKMEASIESMTMEVVTSTEIEGEILNPEQVRSSFARRLGMDMAGLVPSEKHVDGIVEMMLDATQKFHQPLTKERLFGWHAALFPSGFSGPYKITVADWRKDDKGSMQVVSVPLGREIVHYQAPDADQLSSEMDHFLGWFNSPLAANEDPVLRSALAHLWFVTIHPFDDGNGRIGRAIAEMQMARADQSVQRYYSMSAQVRKERKEYYQILEDTQKAGLDISEWMHWFLGCLDRALVASEELLQKVLSKAYSWQLYNEHPLNERQRKMLNMLMDGFEGKLNTSKYAKINICSQDTALREVNEMMNWKILEREEGGSRNISYKLVVYDERV